MHNTQSIAYKTLFTALILVAFASLLIYYCSIGSKRQRHSLPSHKVINSKWFIPNLTSFTNYPLYSQALVDKWRTELLELGLIEEVKAYPMFDGSKLKTHPPFVTSASSNHFDELVKYMNNLKNVIREFTLIIYDLGLTKTQLQLMEKRAKSENFELRRFNFSKYPSYVGSLFEYRWKALVIAEVMKELNVFWYTDTSVQWKHSDLHQVYSQIKCGEGGLCNRSPVTLFGYGGHMLMLTDPGMFKYLPVERRSLLNESMYGATFAFYVKARESLMALRGYVICSLEKDCMAPPGSKRRGCPQNFTFPLWNTFSGCHRYDQSAINLILFEMFNHNPRAFALNCQTLSGYGFACQGKHAIHTKYLD